MILTIKELQRRLLQLPKQQQTLLVGIDGGGGAGKSTLAAKLSEFSDQVTIVHMDISIVRL